MGEPMQYHKFNLSAKQLWRSLIISVASMLTAGCINGGATTPATETKLVAGHSNHLSVPKNELWFDLGSSELLATNNQQYQYKLRSLDNDDVLAKELAAGSLGCKNLSDCILKMNAPKQVGNYVIEIYAGSNFIGARSFKYTIATSSAERNFPGFSINANSTGMYLVRLYANSLKVNLPQAADNLAEANQRIRNYFSQIDQDYDVYVLGDLYFEYLTNTNNLTLNKESLVDFFAQINGGQLKADFIIAAPTLYKAYLLKHTVVEGSTQLDRAKFQVKKINTVVNDMIELDQNLSAVLLHPGFNYAFSIAEQIESLPGKFSLLGSIMQLKADLDQQQLNTDRNIAKLTEQVFASAAMTNHPAYAKLTAVSMLVSNIAQQLDFQLATTDIDNYIRVQTEIAPKVKIEDLATLYTPNDDSGIFNPSSLQEIAATSALIGNRQQIQALIALIQQQGAAFGGNKVINNLLAIEYFKLSTALLEAYQIEKMALYLSEDSKYRNYYQSKIRLSPPLPSGAYANRQQALTNLYKQYLTQLQEQFAAALLK
jgi:hypothetical protein